MTTTTRGESDVDGDELNDGDASLTYRALSGYANWIETGDFLLSAEDAARMKRPYKALAVEQMRIIVRLRELAVAALRRQYVAVEPKEDR